MEYASDGCVLIKEGEYVFEVSTFKREEYASISRHPSTKYYSSNLADDIERRDYTVNALAMTEKLKIVDLCKGQKDLKNALHYV
jgi:tRNA nucleotidyltransferase (CCA-adding enzyme)